MISRISPLWCCALPLALGLLSGCDDPAHVQRLGLRRENFNRSLETFGLYEARRPQNLAYTAEVAREQHAKDVAGTRANPEIVGRAIEGEFQRFHDNQPEYRRRIEEQLRGDPENIERTLPYALY